MPNRNQLLLASRYPLSLVRTEGLLANTGRYLHAMLDAPEKLDVVLMHVPNRYSGIKYEFHDAVVTALAALSSRPAIALGDTNTGVPGLDESTQFFNEREGAWFANLRGAGWIDFFRQRCPDERVATWRTHGGSEFRLDQAFVTESILPRIVTMSYDWGEFNAVAEKFASDHAAILLDLVGV